jgi:hypothetical protein
MPSSFFTLGKRVNIGGTVVNVQRKEIRIIFFCLFIFLCTVHVFSAPKIKIRAQTQGGRWTIDLDDTSLSGGAGTDFASPVESAADLVDVDVSNPQNAWRIDIRRTDSVWHANLRIYARRTTDGTGSGTVSGGTTYQEITTVDQPFITGTLGRSNMKVQLAVDVEVSVGIDNFSTTIYYTATDI